MTKIKENIALPEGYKPFKEILLCSNTLIENQIPILIKDMPVCLFGQGFFPQIWISAPMENSKGKWGYIVENNHKKNPLISIEKNEKLKGIQIKFNNIIILNSRKESEDKVIIDILDFRPFGLNIHGDAKMLNIGTTKISNSRFIRNYAVFAMGE